MGLDKLATLFKFLFVYLCACFVCMHGYLCTTYMLVPAEARKELELQTLVSCHMDAGN